MTRSMRICLNSGLNRDLSPPQAKSYPGDLLPPALRDESKLAHWSNYSIPAPAKPLPLIGVIWRYLSVMLVGLMAYPILAWGCRAGDNTWRARLVC
jgi:hypothetical protein